MTPNDNLKQKFLVKGGFPISGSITPAGNKNEALPLLAVSLLCEQNLILRNIPQILDVLSMNQLLQSVGVEITHLDKNTQQLCAENIKKATLSAEICKSIRASFLLLAPLLHRFGSVEIPLPGGDSIGTRKLDSHFLALKKMGVSCERRGKKYYLEAKKIQGADILLDEASVMATEILIMVASLADGTTRIYNAACEPHVQGLCKILTKMGAKIEGIGSNFLTICGVSSLKGTDYEVAPDHIEIGSFISLAAVLQSKIRILDGFKADLGLVLPTFRKLGIVVERDKNDLIVGEKQEMAILYDDRNLIPKIDDAPWPGFPADLISIMVVTASQCKGNLLIFEKLFESRLFWVDKLISMGAQIVLCDPHRALISGPTLLHGEILSSPDIRAGMALLIASLCAKGESQILNINQIDRGYERIEQRLQKLGANIERGII